MRVCVWCMQESTHSRFAEMSAVLPHPTLLVVISATVRDMRILGVRTGFSARAIGLGLGFGL